MYVGIFRTIIISKEQSPHHPSLRSDRTKKNTNTNHRNNNSITSTILSTNFNQLMNSPTNHNNRHHGENSNHANNNDRNTNNTTTNINQKVLNKMSSILSLGNCSTTTSGNGGGGGGGGGGGSCSSRRRDSLASKSIRDIRDDAIETMVVGVNWALSSSSDCGAGDAGAAIDVVVDPDEHDAAVIIKAEDTTSSCATIPMGTLSDHSRGDCLGVVVDPSTTAATTTTTNCPADLEQAAAATVATLVRASRRRAHVVDGTSSSTVTFDSRPRFVGPPPTTTTTGSSTTTNHHHRRHHHRHHHDEPLPRASKSTPCRSWRLMWMNLMGLLFMVGGIAGATYLYISAPRYIMVDTGIPLGTVVCSSSSSGSSSRMRSSGSSSTRSSTGKIMEEEENTTSNNNNNSIANSIIKNATTTPTDWIENQQEQVDELCGSLEDWKRPCTFVIFYAFTVVEHGDFEEDTASSSSTDDDDVVINDSNTTTATTTSEIVTAAASATTSSTSSSSHQVVYVGLDTWQFGKPADYQCHDPALQQREHATYMASQNMTIHYQEGSNPADTNQYHAPTMHPHSMAAIIAAVCCGLGLMFLCSSLLECVC